MTTEPLIHATPLVPILRDACEIVVRLPSFAHHLAKASVERWFAFELAHALDGKLSPMGWTTLVECGGRSHGDSRVGNFDLLLLPIEDTATDARRRTLGWTGKAIAIELKAAHLTQGEGGRRDGLRNDLLGKPKVAEAAERRCAAFLGVMITTDGIGRHDEDVAPGAHKATAARRGALDNQNLPLAEGLAILERVVRDVVYREWNGRVWVEIVSAATAAAGSP